MVQPTLKAVILEPYSIAEDAEKEKSKSSFLDLENQDSGKRRPTEMYKAYKVVDIRLDLATEYAFTKGSIVLVEELSVNKFTWQGKILYFVNSPQYIPIVLEE